MPTELVHLEAVGVQNLGDQQAQLAVAQDRYLRRAGNMDLIEDFAGGGQRLDEDRDLGGDRIGDHVQIAFGQREKFLECAGMFDDSENRAMRAMAAAGLACTNRNAPQDRLISPTTRRPIRSRGVGLDDLAHEFVAGDAGEP